MEIIFASHNKFKVSEVQEILGGLGIEIRSLNDIGFDDEIIEDGDTLEANAWIKAMAMYNLTGNNVMADDTGLEVIGLNGAPGVHSARYAGEIKDSEANMDKLLCALQDKTNRKARFRTVVACIIDGEKYECQGIVNGVIITTKRGDGGFGYDPIFQPDGYTKTFGELPAEIKNEMSHRARAFQQLKLKLSELNKKRSN